LLFESFVLAGSALAQVNTVYISQNGGTFSGGTACNGQTTVTPSSVTWAAGNTYYICGSITVAENSTGLTVGASGASGSPILIIFDTGAQITSTAMAAGINLGSRSYITIDGGTTCGYTGSPGSSSVACNGTIQNTDNGSALDYQIQSDAVWASGGTNSYIEVRNLNIVNMFQFSGTTADITGCPPHPAALYFTGGGTNVSFHNNIVHDACWVLNGTANNLTVYDNEIYHASHGVGLGNSGSCCTTGFMFYNNYIHDMDLDTTTDTYHQDGVHTYYTQTGSTVINGCYIYNNYFTGNWGEDTTAYLALWEEENCYYFNNLGISTGSHNLTNGAINESTGYTSGNSAYNNTFIGTGSTQTTGLFQISGPNNVWENNIVSTGNMGGNTANWSPTAIGYNLYAHQNGSESFNYCTPGGSCSFVSFATWVSDTGEVNSAYVSNANLSSLGVPQTSSAAIGAGANLHSVCSGQPNPGLGALCYDITGAVRPSTGAWDAGAFNYPSAAPLPPTNLSATAH
jgi:hypothetical protein